MNDGPSANMVVEGDLDEAVLKKVLDVVGIEVGSVYGRRGKDYLREKMCGDSIKQHDTGNGSFWWI
jgi:hypothetical protein